MRPTLAVLFLLSPSLGWAVPPPEVPVSQPVVNIALSVVEAKADGAQWRVSVALVFTNPGRKVVDLDKVSIGWGGRLSNHVFQVRQAGAEVAYQGAMAKRAPPGASGFVHLKPGASERVVVRLDDVYAFPPAGGDFTVRFETANHFSKDDVLLQSNEVPFTLRR